MANAEHYYTKNPSSKFKLSKIKTILRGNELEFQTSSGVFSIKQIDKGTEVLIEHSLIINNSKILDLGCGYGAVGVSIAKAFPSCNIVMSDINERAVKLAKTNLELNNIKENVAVFSGNLYESIIGKFDTILLNPPQNAGRELCFSMIEKSIDYLNVGGSLQIIARKNKGGEVLSKKMHEVFGNVKPLAKKAGYWLYYSKKQ